MHADCEDKILETQRHIIGHGNFKSRFLFELFMLPILRFKVSKLEGSTVFTGTCLQFIFQNDLYKNYTNVHF